MKLRNWVSILGFSALLFASVQADSYGKFEWGWAKEGAIALSAVPEKLNDMGVSALSYLNDVAIAHFKQKPIPVEINGRDSACTSDIQFLHQGFTREDWIAFQKAFDKGSLSGEDVRGHLGNPLCLASKSVAIWLPDFDQDKKLKIKYSGQFVKGYKITRGQDE